ncbi:MAG: hypothetical protein D8B38_06350, partial [Candidatus Saccharimonas sp.]
MSRELARLYTDAPVTLDRAAMAMDNCDPAAVRAMLQRLEFRSLLRQLPPQMQAAESTQPPDAPVVQHATELPAHQAKALFLMAKELLVWPVEGGVWVSHERGKAARLTWRDAIDVIPHVPIVGHRTKELLRRLLARGVRQLPVVK